MERNEVIKALECCTDENKKCTDCPRFGFIPCTKPLLTDALSLIKELTEENKAISERYAIQVVTAIELDKQVQRLTEENERLRAENARYKAEDHEKFDKWMKLEEATKRHHAELFQEAKIAVKEETVRKMKEMMGEYFVEHNEIKYGGGLIHKIIDQIAKEILEGETK